MMDHYKTLGVERSASTEEIKQAYRRLASKYHPDKGGNTEKFQAIEQAYRILSDPNTRAQYDNPPEPFRHPGFGGFPGFGFSFNNFSFEDFFRQQQQAQMLKTTVLITLEQAFNGSDYILNLNTPNGAQPLRITVPRGIEDQVTVRYDNVIAHHSLLVQFKILPHIEFERHGSDVYSMKSISVLDLITGTTIRVKTISGAEFEVQIPANTQPNQNFRIPHQGMFIFNTEQRGHHVVKLQAHIPHDLPESLISAIREYTASKT